jgi:hypothetical protein
VTSTCGADAGIALTASTGDENDVIKIQAAPAHSNRNADSQDEDGVLVIAQVFAHLLLECGLHDRLRQAREQATLAEQLHTLDGRLVDQFLSKPLLINMTAMGSTSRSLLVPPRQATLGVSGPATQLS